MQRTAEAVSIGHPDKTSDYISSYILDRMIEQDKTVKYAVEVMLKGNTVVLGGEVRGNVNLDKIEEYAKAALRDIGYDEHYAEIWGDYALNINKLQVINLIGKQSDDINKGVEIDGWGDQGVFVGYACKGEGNINRELFMAKRLNRALYDKALHSKNLGIDIKTQITLKALDGIETVIVAIPMLQYEDLTEFIVETLGDTPDQIIINGTGIYQYHSSIADCGVTGRKLACDFYSTASAIGGGSPWTKDGSKADVTLNIYARQLALENLKDNDECFVYLSSCIGKAELPSGTIKTIKNGVVTNNQMWCNLKPSTIVELFGLNTPIYAKMCKKGLLALSLCTLK